MNLSNEFQPIRDWANDKRIIQDGTLEKQYTKFQEEAGELAKAILKGNSLDVIDAIGDIIVTLVSVAGIAERIYDKDISIESCINAAYEVIKNRKGTILNGDFHKDDYRTCEHCQGSGHNFNEDNGMNDLCDFCIGVGQIKQ